MQVVSFCPVDHKLMAPTNTNSHAALEPIHDDDGFAEPCQELKLNPDFVLNCISEPLRKAQTGKEAIHGMLQSAVSLGTTYFRSRDDGSSISSNQSERCFRCRGITDLRRALERQVRERLEVSVSEGELPENANVQSLSALCISVLNGLLFCIEDDIPETPLVDSVRLFVESLGFHPVRPLKKRPRRPAAVLPFPKR
jgi:hypothetical protein